MITNAKSDLVKGFAKLKQKQARSETGLFLLEGPQGLKELKADWAKLVIVTPEAATKLEGELSRLRGAGVEVEYATDDVVAKICDTKSPQGVVAVCFQRYLDPIEISSPRLVALLENPADPGNLGTIIRAADAAGADAVAIIEPAVDLYNPKVVRSTAGSIFHIPVIVFQSLESAIETARGWGTQILGADSQGLDVRSKKIDLAAPTSWLFGNEAHGLSQQAKSNVDALVGVPIFGGAESLNLATAATLCMYQSALARGYKD